MRNHAIQTGRVQIKQAQIEGRGHGLWRQLQPMVSRANGRHGARVYAWATEHAEGVIVVDTGSGAHLQDRLPRWHPCIFNSPSASTSSLNKKSGHNCGASASARGTSRR